MVIPNIFFVFFISQIAALVDAQTPCLCSRQWTLLGQKERNLWLDTTSIETLEPSCFEEYLARCCNQTLVGCNPISALIKRCEQQKLFPLSLLYSLHNIYKAKPKCISWEKVLDIWQKYNGHYSSVARELLLQGKLQTADSLFYLFSALEKLDAIDYIEWARCKAILKFYNEATTLLCKAFELQPSLLKPLQHEIILMLSEADTTTIVAVLKEYENCMLKKAKVDSVDILTWLANTYGKYGLGKEQLLMFDRLSRSGKEIADYYIKAARRFQAQHNYRQAIIAASEAFNLFTSSNLKYRCASICADAYLALGEKDSAILWLLRTNPVTVEEKARVIFLCQQRGKLEIADSLIVSLPQGTIRDTLKLRQKLLTGLLDEARKDVIALLTKTSPKYPTHEAILWNIRCALFSSDIAAATSMLDSIEFDATWHGAAELLRFKYMLERLKSDPSALTEWGKIEYSIWMGNLKQAASKLNSSKHQPSTLRTLALRVASECLEASRPSDALAVLESDSGILKSGESLYYYAKAMADLGNTKKASEILTKLLIDYPNDVFSAKARMLFLSIQRSSKEPEVIQ